MIFPFFIVVLMTACSTDPRLIGEKFGIGHQVFVDSVWVLVAINHDRYYSGEKGVMKPAPP